VIDRVLGVIPLWSAVRSFADRAVVPGSGAERTGPAELDFGALYREHVGRVYAYVRYRVANTGEAEDLTADIFEAALSAFDRFDPTRAAPQTWLFGIARNRLSHHFRRQRLRRFLRLESAAEEEALEPAPEELVENRELMLKVRALVGELPERERELLALKFGAGMTNREIAALTSLSESNVGTLVYRALQRLRRGVAE
jgi:RNA polymerase sigma-70 factor (ECF subfamily)